MVNNIFSVSIGKHKLISFGKEVQDRDVADIIVHPEYNATSYFNDIAILKLSRPIEITNYVRPCCLWEDDPELEVVENKVGKYNNYIFFRNILLKNIQGRYLLWNNCQIVEDM